MAAVIENDAENVPVKVKVKNLPLYERPKDESSDTSPSSRRVDFLERKVSGIRQIVWAYVLPMQGPLERGVDIYNTGKAHTIGTLEYIQSDPAILARLGVISVATLGGVVAGYRGGPLRKLTYGTFSGLMVSALCYPKEAVELGNKGVAMTTEYVQRAYKSLISKRGEQLHGSFGIPLPEAAPPTVDSEPDETLIDRGQSKPEDDDLYTTRSS